jgi:hypothetical protein
MVIIRVGSGIVIMIGDVTDQHVMISKMTTNGIQEFVIDK